MSVYDGIIKKNIKGFLVWLRREKNILRINTTDPHRLDDVIDEYIQHTYYKENEE